MKIILLIWIAVCYGQDSDVLAAVDQSLAAAGPFIGGIGSDSPSKPRYNELAWHPATAAVNSFIRLQNRAATQAYVPVLKANVQVVSGLLYTLDIEMAESTCTIARNGNSGNYLAQKCPLTGKGEHQVFRVEIVHQPWMERLEVLAVSRIQQEKPKDIPAPTPGKVLPGNLLPTTKKPSSNFFQLPQIRGNSALVRDPLPKAVQVQDSRPTTRAPIGFGPVPGKLIQAPKPGFQKFEGVAVRP